MPIGLNREPVCEQSGNSPFELVGPRPERVQPGDRVSERAARLREMVG